MAISAHPIDIPYPLNGPGLTPRDELDPHLRLDNGEITCMTCHRTTEQSGVELSLPV